MSFTVKVKLKRKNNDYGNNVVVFYKEIEAANEVQAQDFARQTLKGFFADGVTIETEVVYKKMDVTVMDNCLNCDNSFMKDLFDNGEDMVCICSCDNTYIGYLDEAEKEPCRFKTVKCIRTYFECSKIARDTFGNLTETDFVQAFKEGFLYKIISAENGVYKIFNEQHNISEFGKEITNFFEFV